MLGKGHSPIKRFGSSLVGTTHVVCSVVYPSVCTAVFHARPSFCLRMTGPGQRQRFILCCGVVSKVHRDWGTFSDRITGD